MKLGGSSEEELGAGRKEEKGDGKRVGVLDHMVCPKSTPSRPSACANSIFADVISYDEVMLEEGGPSSNVWCP